MSNPTVTPTPNIFKFFTGPSADAGMNIDNMREARTAATKLIHDYAYYTLVVKLAKGETRIPNLCVEIDLAFVNAPSKPVQKPTEPQENLKKPVAYYKNGRVDVRARLREKYDNRKAAEEALQAVTSSSSSSSTSILATPAGGQDIGASEKDDAQESNDEATKNEATQQDSTKKDVTQQKPPRKTTVNSVTHDQYRTEKAIIQKQAITGITKSVTTTQQDFWIRAMYAIYPFMLQNETAARLLALRDLDVSPENPNPWTSKWHSFAHVQDVLNFKLNPLKWGPLLRAASEHWELYLRVEQEMKPMMDKVISFNPFALPTKTPVTMLKSTTTPDTKKGAISPFQVAAPKKNPFTHHMPVLQLPPSKDEPPKKNIFALSASPFPATAPKKNPLAHHTSILQQPLSKSEAEAKNPFASLTSVVDDSSDEDDEDDEKPLPLLSAPTKTKMSGFRPGKPHTSAFDFSLKNSPKLDMSHITSTEAPSRPLLESWGDRATGAVEKQIPLSFSIASKTANPFSFNKVSVPPPAPLSFGGSSTSQAPVSAPFSFVSGTTSQASAAISFGIGDVSVPAEKPDECLSDAAEKAFVEEKTSQSASDGEHIQLSSDEETTFEGTTAENKAPKTPVQEVSQLEPVAEQQKSAVEETPTVSNDPCPKSTQEHAQPPQDAELKLSSPIKETTIEKAIEETKTSTTSAPQLSQQVSDAEQKLSSASEEDICDDSEATSDGTGATSPKQEPDRQPDGMIEDSLLETFRRMAENEATKVEDSDTSVEEEAVSLVEETTIVPAQNEAIITLQEEKVALIKEPTQHHMETPGEIFVYIETRRPLLDTAEVTTTITPDTAELTTTPEVESPVPSIDSANKPILSFDFEPLEDLECWAKDTFDSNFGSQRSGFQLDQTPFRDLFEPGFLDTSFLSSPLDAIRVSDMESSEESSLLQQLEHTSLSEILFQELTGIKVPKQVVPLETEHEVPVSRGLVITSVSTAPLDLIANVAPTEKTSSISRQLTKANKLPENTSIIPSPVWTALSPTDEAFAPIATDIYHPNHFTQFASILGTVPIDTPSKSRPTIRLPLPTPCVRLPPAAPVSPASSVSSACGN